MLNREQLINYIDRLNLSSGGVGSIAMEFCRLVHWSVFCIVRDYDYIQSLTSCNRGGRIEVTGLFNVIMLALQSPC